MPSEEDERKSKQDFLEELIETRRKLAELSTFAGSLGSSNTDSEEAAELPLSVLFSLSDVIVLTDREGRFLYVCPTVENILGYSVQEVQSMGRIERLLGEEVFDERDLARDKELHNLRREIRDKQGNARTFLINVREISVKDGSILYSCRDITEKAEAEEKLRQSEERYRLLAENSLLGVYIHQSDHFVYSNARLREMLGYTADEIEAVKVWEIFPAEDRSEMKSFFRAQYGGKEQPCTFEKQVKTSDGESKCFDISAVATTYAGQPAVLGTMADITQRKEAEKKLKDALGERDVLLQEIHHRVKNNLAVITGLLSFQTRSPEEISFKQAFEEVAMRIRSMALAHETLIQSESLAAVDMRDYLPALVKEVLERIQPPLSSDKIHTDVDAVKLDIDTAVPVGFIVAELMMSIAKHGDSNGTGRSVFVVLEKLSSRTCRLEISDSDGGLPTPEQMAEPRTVGSQLLSIFVQQLGGEIEPGHHSESALAVRFPCREAIA